MTTATNTPSDADAGVRTVQVHRVYIRVPAQRVWDALLRPEWTDRYGYGGIVHSDLVPGASYALQAGEGMKAVGVTGTVVDGEVLECDPPRRFVQSWRMYMDQGLRAQGFTRLTYELDEFDGVTRLTLIHDCTGAPGHAAMIEGAGDERPDAGGGGWPWVLSDLKSLLETGTAFSRAG
jgi:uncharacterized protein YndB with AHSA1/START domain